MKTQRKKVTRKWLFGVALVLCSIFFFFCLSNRTANQRKMNRNGKVELKHTAYSLSRNGLDENADVDIDIGTFGVPINSSRKLITFDPGDEELITEKFERYPFVIGDVDGPTLLYVNTAFGPCTSLYHRNDHFNATTQKMFRRKNCGPKKRVNDRSSNLCRNGTIKTVPTISVRLSTFLIQKRIKAINYLKIDTQGGDLTIVKDLFENVPEIRINRLKMECQMYQETAPLYHAPNDCRMAIRYIKSKRTDAKLKWYFNSCLDGEYNLLASFQ